MRLISHMPGAGGHFLTRYMEQSHQTQLIPGVLFQPRSHPLHTHYPDQVESPWWRRPRVRYKHRHNSHTPWLRVTVTTTEEWDWACRNAQWKNTQIHPQDVLASDPAGLAEQHVPLSALWTWTRLQQHLPAHNRHQYRVWHSWRDTWCPHGADTPYQRVCDRRWRHLRPAWIA